MAGGEVTDFTPNPAWGPLTTEHAQRRHEELMANAPPEPSTAQIVATILERIDGRIDGRLEAERADVRAYLEERDDAIRMGFDQIYTVLAELVAGGELGMADRWREFVVGEARRLAVRPSEIRVVPPTTKDENE